MKYIFISFTGAAFCIAHRLIQEGNEVLVGQIRNTEDLRTKGWQSAGESPEHRKRRLSIYDGLLEKIDADYLLKKMRFIADRGQQDEYFVVLEHNNLCRYGEIVEKMGFRGLTPNREDYDREKDRKAAHKFVETYYPSLNLLPSQYFTKIEDGLAFIETSPDLLVLKSNGNFGSTIVPRTSSLELNHAQIAGALTGDIDNYVRGGFLLETKVREPIEFAPVLAFWNGKPIYCHVEFECKPLCAGDIGPDAGGAINLCLELDLENSALDEFFPPIVYEIAKARPGLFLFDAGVLYDSKSKQFYFTEFAGNRWGWGGAFSELTMAKRGHRVPSSYFESLTSGKSPFRFKFGATVTVYGSIQDTRFANVMQGGVPVYIEKKLDLSRLYLQNIKAEKKGWKNVGVKDDGETLGYATGYGNTLQGAVERAYEIIDGLSFEGMLFRHKEDFYSEFYPSSILNRLRFFNDYFMGGSLDLSI